MTAPEITPRVSVIVFLRAGHDMVRETVASLGRQSRFEEIEVILADGRSDPEENDLLRDFPWLRRLALPGENMPRLKGEAVRAARGDIVAILDPWDAAPPNWIDEILAGLQDDAIGAVGGTVILDGAPTAANYAAYLFEYGAFNPPVSSGPTLADLPGNNVAHPRDVLLKTCRDVLDTMGFNKPFCHGRIRASGHQLVMRPSMQVRHLTSYRFLPFSLRRFQYGRCFGANRRRMSSRGRAVAYCLIAPVVPPLLMARHLSRALGHPANRRLLPKGGLALMGVCLFWGVGEWMGYWFGAGRSCEELY